MGDPKATLLEDKKYVKPVKPKKSNGKSVTIQEPPTQIDRSLAKTVIWRLPPIPHQHIVMRYPSPAYIMDQIRKKKRFKNKSISVLENEVRRKEFDHKINFLNNPLFKGGSKT